MVWFVIFVVWPLAELFVIIKVSEAIGFLWMLLLLLISWPVGSRVLRAQGRAAWRQFGEAVQAGRPPGNEVLNGALVLAGGLLLMVPGFITDVIGLLLLLPPTRALARRAGRAPSRQRLGRPRCQLRIRPRFPRQSAKLRRSRSGRRPGLRR